MSTAWEAAELDYAEYFISAFKIKTELETVTEKTKERRLFRKKQTPMVKVLEYDPRIKECIRRRNRFGIAPIHTAAFHGSKKVLKTFMQCDPSASNFFVLETNVQDKIRMVTGWQYPLNLAILGGSKGSVQVLLEAGADPFVRDSLGQNAWDVAKATMQRKIWQLLQNWCLTRRPQSISSISSLPSAKGRSMEELRMSRRRTGSSGSFMSLTDLTSSERSKVPHGPWDLEGCFIQAACGSCPEAPVQNNNNNSTADDELSTSGESLMTESTT